MPKVNRNYERKDLSYLLHELHSADLKEEKEQEEKPSTKQPDLGKIVDIAHRKRSSKMDNRMMRYAYSISDMVLHDRDCKSVKDISDDDFEMLSDFDSTMRTCKYCYRNALIRQGIKDDGKRLRAYVWFFKNIGASDKDLYKLLIEHQATLTWQDMNTIKIHVNEDSWEIVHNENGNLLYHNNYIYLKDYSRYFTEGYHEQVVYGRKNFHNIIQVMLNYSWADHIEKMRAENIERKKMNIANTVTKISDDIELRSTKKISSGVVNCYQLKKFSFRYVHFVILDTNEYLAEQIFIKHKVKVHYEKKYAEFGSKYVVVFCKVRKKQLNAFHDSMQELGNKVMQMGHSDYKVRCEQLDDKISQNYNAAKTVRCKR